MEWRNNIMKNLVICIYHQFYRRPNQKEICAGHRARVAERRDVYGVLWGILIVGDHLDDTELHEVIIFKWVFK